MARLSGRTALITGGAAGIGAATARLFIAEGARVFLVDRDADTLARTLAALHSTPGGETAAGFAADIADSTATEEAVARCLTEFGALDVLVNNAARRHHGAVADATAEDWHTLLAVNLSGSAGYCRAALPALRRSGHGAIVNVSSCYGVTGRKGMGLYDASKAGLLALTRTLAHEEAPHGVRANAVCPGPTLTEFHLERARQQGVDEAALRTARKDVTLLGRWGRAEEIAAPILWLASDEASYITGSHLMVDGGLSAM
jgi:meso-butanediol dehydrogenase/(S,S)-butanediol dehydrogenase/diacetyl reductase